MNLFMPGDPIYGHLMIKMGLLGSPVLFALEKDALHSPNCSRDLPHLVSYLVSSLVGFLSYPKFLHCMKYVYRVPSG